METCQWHSIILHFHAFYPHYKNASFINFLNNIIVFAVLKSLTAFSAAGGSHCRRDSITEGLSKLRYLLYFIQMIERSL